MSADHAPQEVQADPLLVRCLTLHHTVLEHSAHGLTKEEIYQRVEGYSVRWRQAQFLPDADRHREIQALERRFSDDKRYLRTSGIPLQETLDVTGDHRYRIDTGAYGLPEVDLTATERLVLARIGQMFASSNLRSLQHALWAVGTASSSMGDTGGQADDIAVPDRQVTTFHTSVASDSELNQLLDVGMLGMGQPVTFPYIRRGSTEPHQRWVLPLSLQSHGHWYLAAYDLDRSARRLFRLDRISGSVKHVDSTRLSASQRQALDAYDPHQDRGDSVERLMAGLDSAEERRRGVDAVRKAHQGPAAEPGRLRPTTGGHTKDDNTLKTDRVLNLTAHILAEGGAQVSGLLQRYSISAAQLHRDLLSVEQSGPNVGMSRYVTVSPDIPLSRQEFTEQFVDPDVLVTLTVPEGASSPFMHKPVSLTRPGALSLLIGIQMFLSRGGSTDPLAADAAETLRQKVLGIVPDALASAARSVMVSAQTSEDARLAVIAHAVEHREVVTVEYVDAATAVTVRDIEPVAMVHDGPRSYVRAWCRHAHGERYFRTDRIRAVTPVPGVHRSVEADRLTLSAPQPPRPPAHPEALDRVILRFAPCAAVQAESYRPEAQRTDAHGAVYIRTYFNSLEALITTCLEAEGDIEVLAPLQLREAVRQAAADRLETTGP